MRGEEFYLLLLAAFEKERDVKKRQEQQRDIEMQDLTWLQLLQDYHALIDAHNEKFRDIHFTKLSIQQIAEKINANAIQDNFLTKLSAFYMEKKTEHPELISILDEIQHKQIQLSTEYFASRLQELTKLQQSYIRDIKNLSLEKKTATDAEVLFAEDRGQLQLNTSPTVADASIPSRPVFINYKNKPTGLRLKTKREENSTEESDKQKIDELLKLGFIEYLKQRTLAEMLGGNVKRHVLKLDKIPESLKSYAFSKAFAIGFDHDDIRGLNPSQINEGWKLVRQSMSISSTAQPVNVPPLIRIQDAQPSATAAAVPAAVSKPAEPVAAKSELLKKPAQKLEERFTPKPAELKQKLERDLSNKPASPSSFEKPAMASASVTSQPPEVIPKASAAIAVADVTIELKPDPRPNLLQFFNRVLESFKQKVTPINKDFEIISKFIVDWLSKLKNKLPETDENIQLTSADELLSQASEEILQIAANQQLPLSLTRYATQLQTQVTEIHKLLLNETGLSQFTLRNHIAQLEFSRDEAKKFIIYESKRKATQEAFLDRLKEYTSFNPALVADEAASYRDPKLSITTKVKLMLRDGEKLRKEGCALRLQIYDMMKQYPQINLQKQIDKDKKDLEKLIKDLRETQKILPPLEAESLNAWLNTVEAEEESILLSEKMAVRREFVGPTKIDSAEEVDDLDVNAGKTPANLQELVGDLSQESVTLDNKIKSYTALVDILVKAAKKIENIESLADVSPVLDEISTALHDTQFLENKEDYLQIVESIKSENSPKKIANRVFAEIKTPVSNINATLKDQKKPIDRQLFCLNNFEIWQEKANKLNASMADKENKIQQAAELPGAKDHRDLMTEFDSLWAVKDKTDKQLDELRQELSRTYESGKKTHEEINKLHEQLKEYSSGELQYTYTEMPEPKLERLQNKQITEIAGLKPFQVKTYTQYSAPKEKWSWPLSSQEATPEEIVSLPKGPAPGALALKQSLFKKPSPPPAPSASDLETPTPTQGPVRRGGPTGAPPPPAM